MCIDLVINNEMASKARLYTRDHHSCVGDQTMKIVTRRSDTRTIKVKTMKAPIHFSPSNITRGPKAEFSALAIKVLSSPKIHSIWVCNVLIFISFLYNPIFFPNCVLFTVSAMLDENLPIHDVLIIGAGPCGLAVAARLCEPLPSALFTENEHQKFHLLRSSTQRRWKATRTSRRSNIGTDQLLSGPCVSSDRLDIKVLDADGDTWMNAWNEKFESLNISHLRSPMFFHPDPRDRDGLLAFAFMNKKENELKEIQGVVGKELSKHHRKKKQKGG